MQKKPKKTNLLPGEVGANRCADLIPMLKWFKSREEFSERYLILNQYIKWLDSMSANAELKYSSFMITYEMMRKKLAGKKLKCHLDLMLGISTELKFIFCKASLEVSPLS